MQRVQSHKKSRARAAARIAVAAVSMIGTALAAQSPQLPLAPNTIPKFVQPLPQLQLQLAAGAVTPGGMTTVFGNQPLAIKMCEFQAAVLPPGTPVAGPAAGAQPLTWVWGYLVDPDPAGLTPCATLASLYANPLGAVDTYIGPVIVSNRGHGSTDVRWVNELGDTATTNLLAYKYSTDQTLHWADPLAPQADEFVNMCMMRVATNGFVDPATGLPQSFPPPGDPCAQNYEGPIPAAPHLHGGEQPAEIDGSPDSWWTSDGLHFGHKYYSFPGAAANAAIYRYPNTQEAAPIWFHDHTLGATRLNVYMGLAGAYYIQDPALLPPPQGTCVTGCLPANLQPLDQVVPLVLQDRMFDTSGQLFFPADSAGGVLWALNPEHPYWVPEFVGDTIVINGKAWPFQNVERKRYRFLFLNGSNARTYEMFLVDPVSKVNGPPMWVIATDGGYLDAPVKIDPAALVGQRKLVIQPGERYEVIIDFGDPVWLAANPTFSGTLLLRNTGRTPYPKGEAPHGSTLGQLMQFVVNPLPPAVADTSYDPASGAPLRSATGAPVVQRLVNPATGALAPGVVATKTRAVTLNEVMGAAVTAIDPVTGALTAYPGGPLEILVNNTKWSGKDATVGPLQRSDFKWLKVNGVTTGFSELPQEGDTEVWEIINLTADAHPIHLHLVQFQLLNRQNFNLNKYSGAYAAAFGTNPDPTAPLLPGCAAGAFCPGYGPPLSYDPALNPRSGGKYGGNPDIAPFLQGPVQPPLPSEAGWKDTAINYPGTVTRYAVRWAPNAVPIGATGPALAFPFDPGGGGEFNYVWHCHIIDHEDNEMMRPDMVTPLAGVTRSLVRGAQY